MGMSAGFINAHVTEWETRLSVPFQAYRAKWPSRLFHHAALENAARILRSGRLLSRVDSEGVRAVDVAPAELIGHRIRAHHFARFYFRPRTPTQYWIEGIRRSTEYYQGRHAPILVMFVFDARRILALPGVRFSDGNMQSYSTRDGDTEEFFATINWNHVFHNSATSDSQVRHCRCAEVLVPSPLPLDGSLQWVFCRSQAERTMLIDALESHSAAWRGKIRVSDDMQVFEKRYTYVNSVTLLSAGLSFELHPRMDGQTVTLGVRVWDDSENRIIDYTNASFTPISREGAWIVRYNTSPPRD
jgi:hypothetical protein